MVDDDFGRLWTEMRETESRLAGRIERMSLDTKEALAKMAQDANDRHRDNQGRLQAIEHWQWQMQGAARVSRLLWLVAVGVASLVGYVLDWFRHPGK